VTALLPDLVDRLAVAEQEQTDYWLKMLDLAEALHRERRRYFMALTDHDRFVYRAGLIVAQWEDALAGWLAAKSEVAVCSGLADGLLR
jgi:dsDNA-binding SOS-regulon protein